MITIEFKRNLIKSIKQVVFYAV